ncbi:MAG: galactokinase [Armatimonadota bacterium]|nr:galactokinase [Armatimonadota bacterium]MDR7518614.1 galactokinase [Armatimonadota bacterium]MDR7548481.1 galactokinase [Armatimonadota bacterium]
MAFRRLFGANPEVDAAAAGRVNLLGEHTDYNDGYVLPTALPSQTRVLAARADGVVEAYAEEFTEVLRRVPGEGRQGNWLDYVAGCLWALDQEGLGVAGARIYLGRGVPVGAGLASSAALEVGVLRALRALYGIPLDDLRLALIAHRAEVEYVGVRCGVMDQIAAALARPGQALFLDTRTLAWEAIPIPDGFRFVVVDSGVPRRLAEAGYNRRRAECEAAAARLGVRALRDVAPEALDRVASLPDPLNRRARHVVTENARVLEGVEALRRGDAEAFGRLMLASHRSLRDDYDVSTQELDRLVYLAVEHGALGARLTGAGFGGCIVALVPADRYAAFGEGIRAGYEGATLY